MQNAFLELSLFAAKTFIIVLVIFIILILFFALLARGKQKLKGHLSIKNLNKKYLENAEFLLSETLSKKDYKNFLKSSRKTEKARQKSQRSQKNVFVLNFHGDIKASAVENLREEITAVLNAATTSDEVVVKIDSGGGMVNAYGLAAAQLMRIRNRNIPLTVTIDKIAASGGYMMACVANRILAAPFAIVGSIGVIVQLPNFYRLLREKHIDVEQHTAGEFKRTITVFGRNTEEGREKLQEEIEEVHDLFKKMIVEYRPHINIKEVATGEHWMALQGIDLKLVDEIKTSDDYLLERAKKMNVFEVSYEMKKSFATKFTNASSRLYEKLFTSQVA